MSFRKRLLVSTLLALSAPLAVACALEESPPPPAAGGGSGTGGSGGATAGAGTGGTTAGTGGATAGMGGSGGSAGAATGGTSGVGGGGAGSGGAGAGGAGAGGAGAAGMSGAAGAAGAMGGMSGSAGAAGTAGASGSGGAAGAAGGAGTAGSGGSAGGGAFTLTSPAFENVEGCSEDTPMPCERFPDENISFMQEMNISPELTWTGAPAGTMSFVMLLQDRSNGFAHWALWNIPASTTMLAANVDKSDATPAVPAGSQQCNLSTGDGYFGPGSECNVYEFVVFALSIANFAPTQATDVAQVRTQLLALDDQILGQAYLRGRSNYNMDCMD